MQKGGIDKSYTDGQKNIARLWYFIKNTGSFIPEIIILNIRLLTTQLLSAKDFNQGENEQESAHVYTKYLKQMYRNWEFSIWQAQANITS